jgi:hypothetical protein
LLRRPTTFTHLSRRGPTTKGRKTPPETLSEPTDDWPVSQPEARVLRKPRLCYHHCGRCGPGA